MSPGGRQGVQYLLTIAILVAIVVAAWPFAPARASQLTSRKLTLIAGATDGGSKPGGVVKHQFDFTIPSGGTVGSIKLQYCTTAAGTCTLPSGLVTTNATWDAASGVNLSDLDNSTNGSPFFYASSAVTGLATNVVASFRMDLVTNPTTSNQSFYVRIFTYASTDTSGTAIDTGIVAASTASPIVLTGQMPESLIFCTGATIGTSGGVPNCASATSGSISFNQLFSPSDTATATSQMAASTNAESGYNVVVFGNTLTSGSNQISAMGTSTTGTRGISQFGFNLKANTTLTSTPAIGAEVAPSSNGTNLRAQPLTGYNTVDNFKYTTGDSIADSGSNGSPSPSDSQIYTLSYIVNVPGSQPAGTYTTTLTYICTPTF